MATRADRLKRVALDFGCILTGLGVIVHQTVMVPPGRASEALLVAAVSILGIPAGVGLLSLRSGTTGATSALSSHPEQGSVSRTPSSPSPTTSGVVDS